MSQKSGKDRWEVPVYTQQTVEVTANSEQEAREKAMKQAHREDGEMFTEAPRRTEKTEEIDGESDT